MARAESGQIGRLHVNAGDTVTKGQLLAEIDPRIPQAAVSAGRAELANLKARLTEQYAQLELTTQQQARTDRRHRIGAIDAQGNSLYRVVRCG